MFGFFLESHFEKKHFEYNQLSNATLGNVLILFTDSGCVSMQIHDISQVEMAFLRRSQQTGRLLQKVPVYFS